MPIASLESLDLYYEIRGQGPQLVFINGTGADLRVRPNVFDGPLVAQFEVLSFDQRGLGQSAKPDCEYHMADYARDAAQLLEHLGWARTPVVGVSFGGMVAQELALRYPQLVSALVLACTSSGGDGGASYPLHELAKLTAQARAEQHIAIADLRRDEQWRLANPERWQKLLSMALAVGPVPRDEAGAARQLAARAGHDTFARLPQLDLPVLVMGGQYDGIAPVSNQQALASQITGAQLQLYNGGHMFMVQDKSAYVDMRTWLSSLPIEPQA